MAAAGLRVLTAGVYGASIGGGMVILFGLPLIGVLIIHAVIRFVSIEREHRRLSDTNAL